MGTLTWRVNKALLDHICRSVSLTPRLLRCMSSWRPSLCIAIALKGSLFTSGQTTNVSHWLNTRAPGRVHQWQRPLAVAARQYCSHVKCPLLCWMFPFSGTSSLFYQTHLSFICLTRQVLISPSLGAVQCIAGRTIKFWIAHWIPLRVRLHLSESDVASELLHCFPICVSIIQPQQ